YNGACYKMLACDLTNIEKLESLLLKISINQSAPTLLLSEVVLTYINPSSADKLITWSCAFFSNAIFISYEQIYPHDEFGNFMCEHFKSIGSPLKCINKYPTLSSQVQRYCNLGYESSIACSMAHYYIHHIKDSEKFRIFKLEQFDEDDEWYLKCSHYFILNAFHGSCVHLEKVF
ncbi:hypothetical protein HELRODRAFT_89574, partial [Helobdella robusta]|uniref:Uncharacterized protein n=1 Tax=Helobdella robusta TaxID=6412 RepID=T1G7E5_HELRO